MYSVFIGVVFSFHRMLKMYAKAECAINMLYMFVIKEWQFDNTNTRKLWSSLSQEDRETFQFSLNSFAWKPYMKHYYNGIRKYLLHEDPDNIAKAQAKRQKYDFFGLPAQSITVFRKLFFLKSF